MKLKVFVNQRHINKGVTSGASCPIALALKDQGFKDVDVSDSEISFTTEAGNDISINPTAKAYRFINRFDGGYDNYGNATISGKDAVKPTVFTFEF